MASEDRARYHNGMDEKVIAAMARWPSVPDVFGWLSLNAAGHWRVHRDGAALAHRSADVTTAHASSDGEPIVNQRMNQFINRNYASDAHGRWYFQNGPQRVYARLDVAPFVLHTVDDQPERPVFLTHNGLDTEGVTRWCLDDAGYLYAETELGAGLIASRDLARVFDSLATTDGDCLQVVLDDSSFEDVMPPLNVRWGEGSVTTLNRCRFDQVPGLLGFVRHPQSKL